MPQDNMNNGMLQDNINTETPQDDINNDSLLDIFYERHSFELDALVCVVTIVLGFATAILQPYLDDCVRNRLSARIGSWWVFVGLILAYAFLVAISVWTMKESKRVLSEKDALVSEKDNAIAILRDSLSEHKRCLEHTELLKECMSTTLMGVSSLAVRNAQRANDAVHAVYTKTAGEPSERSFEADCKSACKLLRETLNDRFGSDVSFEVSYVRLMEESANSEVMMVAGFATQNGEAFSVLGVPRRLSERNSRFDVQLFQSHESGSGESESAVVLLTKEEVLEAFAKPRKPKRKGSRPVTRNKDYRQYVALPVVCPSLQGAAHKKMVGLLQVVVVGSEVWEERSEADAVVGDYLIPVANQLLLTHKLLKALRVYSDKADEASRPEHHSEYDENKEEGDER